MARTKKENTEVKTEETKKRTTRKKEETPADAAPEVVIETEEAVKTETVKEVEAIIPAEDVILAKKENDEIELLKQQIELLKAQLAVQVAQPQQPIQAILYDSKDKVHLLWQAEVANDNVLLVGDNGMYGRIVGKTGSAFIPKNELSRVLDSAMRMYIDKRWMIVVSGLDEEEKESLGVNYKEGEILDKQAFAKMLDLGDELLEIYPDLCDSHKEMVAKRFLEAYHNHVSIKRDLVVALNKIHSVPAFRKIIEEMNESELS